MTQSANARPCNCDQALKAEEELKGRRQSAYQLVRLAEGLAGERDALQLTCAAQGQKLAAVERILCDLVSAPSLTVAQFADPTLERIRLAMLGRER